MGINPDFPGWKYIQNHHFYVKNWMPACVFSSKAVNSSEIKELNPFLIAL